MPFGTRTDPLLAFQPRLSLYATTICGREESRQSCHTHKENVIKSIFATLELEPEVQVKLELDLPSAL